MKNSKLFIWIIAILLIMNIGLMTTILVFFRNHPAPPPPFGGELRPPIGEMKMVQELNLSKAQKDKYEQLRNRQMGQVREMMDSLRLLKDLGFREVLKDNVDFTKALNYIKLSSALQYKIDTLTVQFIATLRGECTAEQRAIFDKTFFKFIGPPPGIQPPPRHD